jgi:hypothetical protein
VLDRLFVLAQRDCTLRVIERVADGRGWIGGWLSLLLAADGNLDEHFQKNTMEDVRGHDDVRDGVLVEKGESGQRKSQSRLRVFARLSQSTKVKYSHCIIPAKKHNFQSTPLQGSVPQETRE